MQNNQISVTDFVKSILDPLVKEAVNDGLKQYLDDHIVKPDPERLIPRLEAYQRSVEARLLRSKRTLDNWNDTGQDEPKYIKAYVYFIASRISQN